MQELAMFRTAFAALALVAATPALAASGEDILRITLDQAQVAKLPPNTATVVIGNPAIADVTALKGNTGMIVTGRSFGHTNMIALDAAGNLIDEKQIHVEPVNGIVTVQRGLIRESYSCDPRCMPAAILGDDAGVFGSVSGEITAHDTLAKSH
jgi:Flp pilus assembly secretin CpaC